MGIVVTPDFLHANFFFVDIVGLSDPIMSTKTQIKKIKVLNESIKECDAYKNTPKESILTLPSGDGMCLGFLQDTQVPLLLASQLHEKLNEYNKGKIPSEIVRIRIGLHSGNCFVVDDIVGNKSVWGPGIVLCRRVMDFGDDGHILLTARLAEDLYELSDEYKQYIKPVHDFTIKHGQTILVYSAYGKGFGNPKHPTKGKAERSKIGEEYLRMQKTTLYSKIIVDLTIKNSKTMLVQHKRQYEIKNIHDEPIDYVLHGIATDVDKNSINDLNIKVYDENNREMKISSINVDRPDTKEFTTQFNKIINKGDEGRGYTLEYEVEEPERYFENAFLIDCNKLQFSLTHDNTFDLNQVKLWIINQETDEKRESKTIPTIEKNEKTTKILWDIQDSVKGQTFRVEW